MIVLRSVKDLEETIFNFSSNIFCGIRGYVLPVEKDFNNLFCSMKKLNGMTGSQEFVGKKLAGVYFDLSTAIYSAVEASDENADFLMSKFDEFCDIARNYFSIQPSRVI